MRVYRARLYREYPCGSKKFLEYYFKHSSFMEARRKVRKRYKNWTLTSLRLVGGPEFVP